MEKPLIQQIQEVYETAYIEAVKEATPNQVTIGVTAGGVEHQYVEKNFYWCGFSWIEFAGKGKNLQLKKEVGARPKYGGGFTLNYPEKIGNRGNGDYELQRTAFSKVAEFLNNKGFNVYADGRLD